MLSEVPSGWCPARLGELVACKPEYGANVAKSAHNAEWPRYLRITDINESGGLKEDVVSISPSDAEPYILDTGDLVIARSGATVGKSYLYRPQDGKCAFAGYLIRFRLNEHRVEPAYIAQYLQSDDYARWVSVMVRAGAQPNINAKEYSGLPIPLPPLPEQKQIAAILSSVDEAIQATQAVIQQTRRVKEGLLQDLLTRGIGHTRFKQTKIGEIPEEWEVAKLKDLGLVDCGKAKNKMQEAPLRPYLRVANVLDGKIDHSDVFKMPFSDKEFEQYRLEPGDILLNEGQSLELVGRPAVYRGLPPSVAMQNALLRWRVDPKRVNPEFGYQAMRQLYGAGVFSRVATQTTSIAHLGLKRFASIVVAIPPIAEQKEIAAILASGDEAICASQKKLDWNLRVKAGLLQDLLTGKVRASV